MPVIRFEGCLGYRSVRNLYWIASAIHHPLGELHRCQSKNGQPLPGKMDYLQICSRSFPGVHVADQKWLASYLPTDHFALHRAGSSEISQNELFYAAQSAENIDKEIIYKNYIKLYPNDWKAYNNLSAYYIYTNKISDAENYLDKAKNIDENNATILNNYGVLYYSKGDFEKAEEYFNKSKVINDNIDIGYNIGVLQIKQAKYFEAIISFGYENSFNKALAQLLAGMNESAQNTLDNIKSESAYYYYLQAIIATKNNNQGIAFENLREAIKIDETIKDYAKNDMEFRQYFENSVLSLNN